MSDLVERLRSPCDSDTAYYQRREAADEIERLLALLDRHHKWQLRCGPHREYCEAALYDETRKALEGK